jgi:hypothetical protein
MGGMIPPEQTSHYEKVGAMKTITNYGIGLALYLAVTGLPADAQNQTPPNPQPSSAGQSLGDYARHVRKAPEPSSKPKVFDNDNLPKTEHLSVVGSARPAVDNPAEAKAATQDANTTATASSSTEAKPATADKTAAPSTKGPEDEAAKQTAWKQWGEKVKTQQQQVDLVSRELDVVQREYQIRAAAMYADAGNRLRNQADWDKQDAQYKQQIADKQKAVEDAKVKLEELKDQAHRAGVPDSFVEP